MTVLVEYSEREHHCLVTIDDGKANALSFALLEQLNGALEKAEGSGKVLIVCGRSGKFSAGFDLSIMGQGGEAMVDLLRAGALLSRRLLDHPTPVILAVSGHALAMGALLLLSADYRIGVHGHFKIGLNEVAIGMTLPYFGVELARERLLKTHLLRAVTFAEVFDPDGAIEAGYLDEAVAPDDLLPRCVALAEQLAGLDMEAHRQTKARIREGLNSALDEAISKELGDPGRVQQA